MVFRSAPINRMVACECVQRPQYAALVGWAQMELRGGQESISIGSRAGRLGEIGNTWTAHPMAQTPRVVAGEVKDMTPEERAVCKQLLAAVDFYMASGVDWNAVNQARKAMRALLDRPQAQPMTEDEINLIFERWWETKPSELVRYPSPEVTMQWTAFVAGWQAHHHIGEKT